MIRQFAIVIALAFVLGVVSAGAPTSKTAEAAYPGTNGKIVFSNVGTLGNEIYTLDSEDDSEPTLLTSGYLPSWSRDGQQVVFTGNDNALRLINSDGSDERVILSPEVPGERYTYPALSPDGEHLAVVRVIPAGDSVTYELVITDEDGANPQVLHSKSGRAWIQHPRWSPDGTKIMVWVWEENGGARVSNLVAIDVETGAQEVVTPEGLVVATGGDWSPDGTQVVYTAFHPNAPTGGVLVSDVGGSDAHLLYDKGISPKWSPDGQRILFFAADGKYVLSTMDVSGGDVRTVLDNASSSPFADWAPQTLLSGIEFTQSIQELQSIGELQSDLEGDGQPPVPIIAGKPAVMRIYFREVQAETTFNLEVAGHFAGVREITLAPGCTPVERRKQTNNCRSVDYYFTPPEGEWNVAVRVLDDQSEVVEEHSFDLTSVEAKRIVFKAVSVCDTEVSFGLWQCSDPSALTSLVSLTRRLFPAPGVSVQWSPNVVRHDVSDFAQPIQWWGQVDRDLAAMYSAADLGTDAVLNQETYYFGVARNNIPGGVLGAAYLNSRGAAAKTTYAPLGYETIQWVVAHEGGHAMGLDHTNTGAPALSAANGGGCWLGTRTQSDPYPYTDNSVRAGEAPGTLEVGFDVANQVALPGDAVYEMMGYCVAIPPVGAPEDTAWITPFSTLALLEPAGPLSAQRQSQAVTAGVPGDYWLVRGTVPLAGSVAEIEPLFTKETEAAGVSGSGAYRIEVRDAGNALLFMRMFDVAFGHGSPGPGEAVQDTDLAFSELVPVHSGAATLVIVDPFQSIIGQITLGGAAPTVAITLPQQFSGPQALSWQATDPDSPEHFYWLDYSPDDGETWHNLGQNLDTTALTVDFDQLPASGGQALFRVIASDGVNSGEATSVPFTVVAKPPHADIIGPQRTSFRQGDLVWLEAAAWDTDDGTLDGSAVIWSSSRDGALGAGASLHVYDLTPGQHTITMTARDSDNNTVTDTISFSVSDAPIVEGEESGDDHLWGDNDCDGSISSRDNQALSRFVLQQNPLSQTQPCPLLGATVTVTGVGAKTWGDLDCDGQITSRDGQALLRNILQQNPLSQTQPCPALGDSVTTQPAAVLPSLVGPMRWWN